MSFYDSALRSFEKNLATLCNIMLEMNLKLFKSYEYFDWIIAQLASLLYWETKLFCAKLYQN
jgi:hypothetical protein